jgi:predicted aldo/keto reductase-like oxidoreductase
MSLSRRSFLESAAASALAAHAALAMEVDEKSGMPTRVFGQTGARVSILAFGCGSRWLAYREEDKAIEAMNKAIDLGVTYIDTAYQYGNGLSETRVGKVLKSRGGKNGLWVTTKVPDRNGDEARRTLEGSLKRLGLDQVDLCHIHSLTTEDDLAAIEAKDGVLAMLYKLRDQKLVRNVGITSHTDPVVMKTALERHDFNCCQMALNGGRIGMDAAGNRRIGSFETLALPVANRKKMGVIAMKIFLQEKLLGKAPVEKLIQYSMSLPVTATVIGMPKLEYIDANIRIAKAFQPLPPDEMDNLHKKIAAELSAMSGPEFHNHMDG